VDGAPELFDLLLLFVPSEEAAQAICQHLVQCFQFLYREAISAMEQFRLEEEEAEEEEEEEGEKAECAERQIELASKFVVVFLWGEPWASSDMD
jgi:hypothetical protein